MLHRVPISDIRERTIEQYCSKCDSPLLQQSDGSTLTVDIAHQRESVSQALDKFEAALDEAWQSHARQLRLVVGGGVIREEVLAELEFKRRQGTVLDFFEEAPHRGAVLARIR